MVFLIAVLAGIGGIWLFVQFMRVIAQGLILCIIGVAICLRAVWRGVAAIGRGLLHLADWVADRREKRLDAEIVQFPQFTALPKRWNDPL